MAKVAVYLDDHQRCDRKCRMIRALCVRMGREPEDVTLGELLEYCDMHIDETLEY